MHTIIELLAKFQLTILLLWSILSVVVVLWMLEGPTAGGAHAWAPFLLLAKEGLFYGTEVYDL